MKSRFVLVMSWVALALAEVAGRGKASRSSPTPSGSACATAAGVIAALAATSKRLPHEIAWSEGEAKLKSIGQRA